MSVKFKVFKAAMGVQWLKAGWEIFKMQPMTFIMMYVFMVVVALSPLVAPPLQLLAAFAAPFLTAGFYMAVLSKQRGQTISLASILGAFSAKGRRLHLFRLGLYQLGVVILLTWGAGIYFEEALNIMHNASAEQSHELLLSNMLATISMTDVVLFFIAHSINIMAFAYALPIVFFQGETRILKALGLSLKVFYSNMASLGVYGLLIAFLMLATIPLSMIPLLVVMPIAYISFFVSYQDIFIEQQNSPDGKAQDVKNQPEDSGRFDA
ncbi:BPSS1780 family membrane protein [Pseudoalteromonas sp. T1lg23B]|uniref:BPSS1780 family membrane protein n=1 Tax=Pseudoalteromonas sp. T1lg23B TaxID=2077097 RepID=UPI000CF63831|nr:BPSS1780 family membrane protein [Pseudoalteromonas sp. T1lg23B]